jgi:hypothetical protein
VASFFVKKPALALVKNIKSICWRRWGTGGWRLRCSAKLKERVSEEMAFCIFTRLKVNEAGGKVDRLFSI